MFKFKKFIILILTLTFLFCTRFSYSQDYLDIALDKLTEQINQSMLEQKKTKIAILPFPNLSNEITKLGSYLAEELTTNLFMTGKFKIVERSLLKQVLDELKLSQTGVVDPDSAKELGKMAGVDSIVTGTTADLGSYVAVNCRLIETESGEIFAVAKAKIKKDASLTKIMEEVIETPEIKKARQIEKKKEEDPLIIEYENKVYKIKIEDFYSPVLRQTQRALGGDLSGYYIYKVTSALITEDEITFNVLFTNHTNKVIKFIRKTPETWEEPFIYDKFGNKYNCISFTPSEDEQVTYLQKIPVKGTIIFPNPSKKNKNIKTVDLAFQISGKPLLIKYAIFRDLSIIKDENSTQDL